MILVLRDYVKSFSDKSFFSGCFDHVAYRLACHEVLYCFNESWTTSGNYQTMTLSLFCNAHVPMKHVVVQCTLIELLRLSYTSMWN